MDEVPVGNSGVTTEEIGQLSQAVSKRSFLWIACQKNRTPTPENSFLKGIVGFSFHWDIIF